MQSRAADLNPQPLAGAKTINLNGAQCGCRTRPGASRTMRSIQTSLQNWSCWIVIGFTLGSLPTMPPRPTQPVVCLGNPTTRACAASRQARQRVGRAWAVCWGAPNCPEPLNAV